MKFLLAGSFTLLPHIAQIESLNCQNAEESEPILVTVSSRADHRFNSHSFIE